MAKDALLVEWQAAFRGKIRGDSRTSRHARVNHHYMPISSRKPRHRVRKRVLQSGYDLEQRQVGVRQPATDDVGGPTRVAREHTLEVGEVFRQPILEEVGGAPFRFAPLVFVVQARCDRVMGVVRLDDKVCKGELELMRAQAWCLARRREVVAFAEEDQKIVGYS